MPWLRSVVLATVLVTGLAAGLGACVPAPSGEPPPVAGRSVPPVAPGELEVAAEQTERRLRELTLRVRNRMCVGLKTGSGFAVAPRLLITNRHVVEGADQLQVSTWDGRSLAVTVSGYAVHDDLALVTTASELPEVARPGPEPAVGEEVTAVGYPGGGRLRFSTGRILGRVDSPLFGESGAVLRVSSDVRPGNSGGPVVNAAGEVVGVVFAVERPTGHGLAIPISTIQRLVDTEGFYRTPELCY